MVVAPASRRSSVTTKYRIDTKSQSTIDLSAFGQPAQEQNVGLISWVAVTLTDTTGGRVLNVVVDSLKYDGTVPIEAAALDSVKGATLHGLVEPSGRIKDLTANPRGSLVLAQIHGVMNGFFPRMKDRVKAGESWTDTTEVANTTGGANTKIKMQTSYAASGSEMVSGVRATKITSTYTSTVTGTMENPMSGTMEVEGTGTGTGTYYVGPDGRYLGGSSTTNVDQKLKMAMAPAPIPVKTVQTLTVTLIP
jgi:hypothetical protein